MARQSHCRTEDRAGRRTAGGAGMATDMGLARDQTVSTGDSMGNGGSMGSLVSVQPARTSLARRNDPSAQPGCRPADTISVRAGTTGTESGLYLCLFDFQAALEAGRCLDARSGDCLDALHPLDAV